MRFYTVTFQEVAVTAVQDLFELLAPADLVLELHELHITQSSDAADAESEQLNVSVRRVTGAPTSGSGGSTATPQPLASGDAASTVTAEINNTTQLSGGTNTVLLAESFNVMPGLHIVPTKPLRFAPSTRCLVELETAPADSLTMSGWALIAEID